MAFPIEVAARIRDARSQGLAPNGNLSVNERGELVVVHGLPGQTEIVRTGESYFAFQATEVAPIVALPTTTAQLSLWNGEPDGGKSYAIDSLICTATVSAGAATGIGFAGLINPGRVALPSGSLLTPKGLSGQPYNGRGKAVLAATVVDDTWHPIGTSVVGPAGQIGLNVEQAVEGRYLLPPGHLFSLAVLANTVTTIRVKMGIRWHEKMLGVA